MKLKRNIVSVVIILLLSMSLLTACNNTSFEGSANFAEASEIEAIYLESSVKNIIIDARGVEEYKKGHLKNAICISPSDLTISEPVKATIASKSQVEKVLSENGISNDSNIFIYDNKGGVYSSRVWWTLKAYGHENVKIINNGAESLMKIGLEMTADIPKLKETEYHAKNLNENLLASFDEVKKYSENPVDEDIFLLDVRSLPEFEEGFIPGAKFYPHTKNYYNDGTFLSARDIYLFYNDFGIEKDDLVIAYCKSSYRATVTIALLNEAGFENVKVYDGAWLGWQNQGMSAAEVEEDAPVTEQDGS